MPEFDKITESPSLYDPLERLDVGELLDSRLLPITIEATNHEKTEVATRWIQELTGVAQVDVTIVSWESEHPE